jgi:hypothetical protein
MSKRRKLLLICLAALVILATAAFNQSALIGWWRGEAKYKGRYTNSWRAELRSYDNCFRISSEWYFCHTPSRWEQWLSKILPNSSQLSNRFDPPWEDGDPEAIPVLVELLKSPERHVRIIAAYGLEIIGPPARDAIPALLAMLLRDDDEDVATEAWCAIESVDPAVAGEHVGVLRRFADQSESP